MQTNDDATLCNLTLDGITIAGFDSAVFEYNNVDPGNTSPTVGTTPTDDVPKAYVVISTKHPMLPTEKHKKEELPWWLPLRKVPN